MSKTTDNTVKVETWTVNKGATPENVQKVAVRNSLGQFHGATNFRGSIVGR